MSVDPLYAHFIEVPIGTRTDDEPMSERSSGVDDTLFDTADQVRGAAHTAPVPIVEGLLLVGLTLLHGPAKKGKSWFLLHMLLAIDAGEKFLDRAVRRSDALYIGAEDTEVRFKARLTRLFGHGGLKLMSRTKLERFAHRFIDADGKREEVTVEDIITELWAVTGKPRVIAIDTQEVFEALLSITHGKGGDSVTRRDYLATSTYDRIAHKLGIAIVTVGHWGELKNIEKATFNPHECINTTKARLAGVSTSITLGPLPNQEPGVVTHEAQVSVRGRDLEGGDQFLWVKQDRDTGAFNYVGIVQEVQLTREQSTLFETLRELQKEEGGEEWVTAARIAEELGVGTQAVKQMVGRIRKAAKTQGRKPMFGSWTFESKPHMGYRLK